MRNDARELKKAAISMLAERLPKYSEKLNDIDERVLEYFQGLLDGERHNLYELLGGLKFLRLLDVYPFVKSRARHAIKLYEGVWEKKGGIYHHKAGGFRFSGLRGDTHYRLQPFQVFILAWAFGLHKWTDTRERVGTRQMLPTERAGEGGNIEDLRLLAQDVVLFLTRKSGKTQLSSFFGAECFFFGDANAEIYCAANSQEQSKILFKMINTLVHQLDPNEQRIRFTQTEINWKQGTPRQAKVAAMSAGGKKKDGLFPQLGLFDEFGSAEYVKDHCDMLDLVNVIQSGMGPRREPRTVTTTTAGYAVAGPFWQKLEGIKAQLVEELHTPATEHVADFQFAFILEPDDWEKTDEQVLLTDPNVWYKCNPMIGISVQPDFYEKAAVKARLDLTERKEFITKLTNVFQTDKAVDWLKPDEIRRLQKPIKIEDLSWQSGDWHCFVGMDFSLGNDLHAQTYLCYNTATGEFYTDLDAWITEETLQASSIRKLYERWIADGWLHLSPGATLQPELPIARIAQLYDECGVNFCRFGYDPYKAKQPINTLSAWALSLGAEPKDYIVPVRQTFGNYNPAVVELEYMVKNNPPLITFSANPMWPWQFGNCQLAESNDGMENHKPVKANSGDGCKVDNVQCLCSALILFDQVDGAIEK